MEVARFLLPVFILTVEHPKKNVDSLLSQSFKFLHTTFALHETLQCLSLLKQEFLGIMT